MNPLSSLILAAGLLGAPAEAPQSPDPKLLDLVRQLGHKSYKVRETAARDLLKRGSEAVVALNVGTKDTDPEVAERCKQLLPVAAATERNEKLSRLLKDPAGPLPKGLAGLEEFIKIAGDDKTNREIYAEMMGVHYQLIEALEKDPKTAARLMNDFTNEAYDRWQQGARTGRYSYDNILADRGQVAMFLFARGDKRFADDAQQNGRAGMLVNSTKLKNFVTGPEELPGMKKLFLHWMEHEKQPYITTRAFQIAADAKMKEALPVVMKVIADKNQPVHNRAQVMLTLAKLGTKENLKDIEPFLADKTNIGTINFGNGQPLTAQLQDVAMGVCVQLCGQKLADFGFETGRFGGGIPNSYYYYGFPDDKTRDAAHAKWKEFAAKPMTPEKKETPTEKKEETPQKKAVPQNQ
ncbi:hypothetical protein [Zavarzinella formosa]|uniref:hypothetical protein n=1 Tax=Zavarzinella formosa TaxID=360055 RepID=UPI0002FCAD22|nr:hypothetical protein [Zavarzinella formosa]